jgi:sialate O-acetylesterase
MHLRMPAVFSSDMVLQRDYRLPVWGWAAPGADILVALADQEALAAADADGRWRVTLAPLPAGGPLELTVTCGEERCNFTNVMIGDVWVCSGQSNMQWSVQDANDAQAEIAAADHPDIRLLTVPNVVAGSPQDDFEGAWVTCRPDTVPEFSAVGYYFGRRMQKELGVAVGLINSSWGGTPAEAWTRQDVLRDTPALKPTLLRWNEVEARYPELMAQRDRLIPEYEQALAHAEATGAPAPPEPPMPLGPGHCHQPAGLFNAMIAPLIPFAIRGAVWYQGESNADRADEYRTLFSEMIKCWRQSWGQGDFPFIFVQLANFGAHHDPPTDDSWAELREAQVDALALPQTGMAVIIDVGNPLDIHPQNKQAVGLRLTLSALHVAHGRELVHSSPLYDSMAVEGDAVRLRFKLFGSGLRAADGEALCDFAIAGSDRRFVWGQAVLDGDTVLVRSPEVPVPVAVRYAWCGSPTGNLRNDEGLPASPFRTDYWPLMSAAPEDYLVEKYPRPEPLPLPGAPGGIAVDGDLTDWSDVPAMPLPYEGGGCGSVKLCWSVEGLYGAIESHCGAAVLQREAPYQGDALELFVDKSLARTCERDEHASQYIFAPDPENGPGAGVKRVGYGMDIYHADKLQCAWQPTETGYNMEFHIPAALLRPAGMEAGVEIGLNFAVTAPGRIVEQFYASKDLYGGWQRPVTWGIVQLRKES